MAGAPGAAAPAGSRTARRLLLLVLGGLLGLGAAEVAVRLLRPQAVALMPAGLYVPDPPGRYALAPSFHGTMTNRVEFTNRVDTNRLGLRGPEVGERRAGSRRLLALGDSFTFGVGVEAEETFVARAAALIAEQGAAAEGLNGGVPGYHLGDVATWYGRHGGPLKADLVVIAVYLGNDLQDADPRAPGIVLAGGEVGRTGGIGGPRAWLYHHSHLFALLKGALPGGRQLRLRQAIGLGEPFAVSELKREIGAFARTPPAAVGRGAVTSDRALAEIVARAGQRRARVVALLVPHALQVAPARFARALADLGLDPGRYDREAPNRLIGALLARHGIPCLDPTAALAAAEARGEHDYFRFDRHWTRAGHELVARELVRFLGERHLLAPPAPTPATASR